MNQNIKELQETKECTFSPNLNQTTQNLNGRVPIYERELPGPKPNPPPREEEGIEEVKDPHPKRKHNSKFY